jgi:hypothetical protein
MMGGPDTSAQDRLLAEQEAQLAELKKKEASEKDKTSKRQASLMRRQLGGSLMGNNQNPGGTLGG